MAKGDRLGPVITATIDSPGVKISLPKKAPGTRNAQSPRDVLLYFNGNNTAAFYITEAPGETNGIRVPAGTIFEYPIDLSGADKYLYAGAADSVDIVVLEE